MDLRDQLQATLSGSYTLERELGGGGMSRVFVAEETALGRKVVIKVLPPETAAQVSLERFKREILLAAKLQHPHIVPLHSAGESNGLPYFTMPFVEGESLRVRLARHGELPVNDAIRLLREIASALAYAHEHGIVHRDIKPDNVLLSGGSAMVTDFGVAKALSASSNAEQGGVTSLGVALGTPAYMAPEQATADPAIDHRADIYAFGVLAYELLTGQPPFVGLTPQNLLAAPVSESPEVIIRRRASLPPALSALVMRCLEKRPADRPQTAAEIVHALDDITTPSGGTQPTHSIPSYATAASSTTASVGARPSRGPIIAAATVVVLLAAGWAIIRGGTARRSSATAIDAKSIVVLPFTDEEADKSHEYIGDGIADEINSAVGRIPGLTVKARSSAAAFKGTTLTPQQVGESLHVASVLTGRIRRAGNQARITAELVNVANGNTRWSDSYPAEFKDLFAAEEQIARAIASELKVTLGADVQVARAGTSNPKAYDVYLRARFFEDKRGGPALRRAIELYQQAIALDRNFARAYAGLGGSLSLLSNYSDVSSDSVSQPALAAIDRAIVLDSTLAEAYAARGSMLYALYRWNDAERALRRAIQLDPQYGMSYKWLGEEVGEVGRVAEGDSFCRRATELDPLLATSWSNYGFALWAAGKDSATHVAWARALELDPGLYTVREGSAEAFAVRGQSAQALAEIVKQPDSDLSAASLSARAFVFARSGRRGDAERIVRELERTGAKNGMVFAALGYAYLGLGDLDRALDFSIRAARTHDMGALYTPDYDPMRSHPRYAELMRAMNLQDQPIAKWAGGKR